MKFTGERVVHDQMVTDDQKRILKEHTLRYEWAKQFCEDKTVLDASCGTGYGVDIISKVAHNITGVDVSKEAVDYAIHSFPDDSFFVLDLDKNKLGYDYEVITSFETIEHLENPDFFLDNVANSCDMFVFSIPINHEYEYHKHVYSMEQAKALIEKYFTNIEYYEQGVGEDGIKPLTNSSKFILGVCNPK